MNYGRLPTRIRIRVRAGPTLSRSTLKSAPRWSEHLVRLGSRGSLFDLNDCPCQFTSAMALASSGHVCMGNALLVRVLADEQPPGFAITHDALGDELVPDAYDITTVPVESRGGAYPVRDRWLIRCFRNRTAVRFP